MQIPTTAPKAHQADHDAEGFVNVVDEVSQGILSTYQPTSLRVVHVDNWFGPKWLGFSAKVLGALGIWAEATKLTVPPFVPSRILSEQRWQRREDSVYEPIATDASIHVAQSSSANLKRLLAVVAPGEAIVWYSGNSVANQRGSIMAYVPAQQAEQNTYHTWYVQMLKQQHWVASQVKGMSPDAFAKLRANATA